MNLIRNAAFRRQRTTGASPSRCRLKSAFRFRGSLRKISVWESLSPSDGEREQQEAPPFYSDTPVPPTGWRQFSHFMNLGAPASRRRVAKELKKLACGTPALPAAVLRVQGFQRDVDAYEEALA